MSRLLERPWVRRTGRVLAATLVFVGIVTARVLVESEAALQRASAAAAAEDVEMTLAHLRQAASWYAPGNPHAERALQRLASIARSAEREGDVELALRAWRATRSATGAATSLYTPHPYRAREAEQHIGRLMATDAPEIDGAMTDHERARLYARALRESSPPSPAALIAVWFGLFGYCAGLLFFALRGWGADDRLVRHDALRALGGATVGLALLVVGLVFA